MTKASGRGKSEVAGKGDGAAGFAEAGAVGHEVGHADSAVDVEAPHAGEEGDANLPTAFDAALVAEFSE